MTGVPGVRVGHHTDAVGRTGCTVVLLPAGTVASGEVRGGAPGTREFALLEPHRLVDRVDAVVLAGGSAFGLAACDGVVRWCEERGIGFPTPAGPVPIVIGMVLFDRMVGDPQARPTADDGYTACTIATTGDVEQGAVGAGTGATVGKASGRVRAGGIGIASETAGGVTVTALVAVNAFGDVLGPGEEATPLRSPEPSPLGTNTTIGVVATDAVLTKAQCLLVAQSAHDGLARAVSPAHTTVDGDAFVAAATGTAAGAVAVDVVRDLAAHAVTAAIRRAVEIAGQR